MALELPVAPHAGAHQFETQRGQELGDAPATFVLSRLNLNLSKRRICERLRCAGKDLLCEIDGKLSRFGSSFLLSLKVKERADINCETCKSMIPDVS
jgi:hypothetical protein